jgi:hypothetical protein
LAGVSRRFFNSRGRETASGACRQPIRAADWTQSAFSSRRRPLTMQWNRETMFLGVLPLFFPAPTMFLPSQTLFLAAHPLLERLKHCFKPNNIVSRHHPIVLGLRGFVFPGFRVGRGGNPMRKARRWEISSLGVRSTPPGPAPSATQILRFAQDESVWRGFADSARHDLCLSS